MDRYILLAADLAAISAMVFGLYFPRHARKGMVVSYLVANVGVMAAAIALSTTTLGAGLGLGLFGILSIIRLRSDVLDPEEVAYYFASLALGLLAGIGASTVWLTLALMVAVLGALYVGDHPELFPRHRIQIVTLDAAITSEPAVVERLEALLGARVQHVVVRKLDLVQDTTQVEVRYELSDAGSAPEPPLPWKGAAR